MRWSAGVSIAECADGEGCGSLRHDEGEKEFMALQVAPPQTMPTGAINLSPCGFQGRTDRLPMCAVASGYASVPTKEKPPTYRYGDGSIESDYDVGDYNFLRKKIYAAPQRISSDTRTMIVALGGLYTAVVAVCSIELSEEASL